MTEPRPAGVCGQFHTLFNAGTLGGRTDQELLDRFVHGRDEDAFAALVQRHAPMVLRVCLAVLRDTHDAEDASQATFLILARKARSIRSQTSVGSWLFGVARRVAGRARTDVNRRRVMEQRCAEIAKATHDRVSAQSWSEVCDELERLPAKYRVPIILCDLESLTHEQAAVQLRQPARTFRRRLAEGREMLRTRLARQGFTTSSGLLAVGFDNSTARELVSTAWVDATARAATRVVAGQATTLAASARVAFWVEGVIAAMFLSRLKGMARLVLVSSLIASGASVFARNLWEDSAEQGPTTPSHVTPRKASAEVIDPKEMVTRIADHIQKNDASLRTVRTKLKLTVQDRSVAKRVEITTKLTGGAMAQIVREPLTVSQYRVLLRGDDLLREAMEEDGETWCFHEGVWTHYVPMHKRVWRGLPEQMPGLFPLDPRNMAAMEQEWRFVDWLREDRVLEVRRTQTSDGQARITVLLEHSYDKERTERYRCEFDPERNHLPTRVVVFREGDEIGIVHDIDYQEVIPGATWFLKKATRKFFGPKLAKSPESEEWRQAMTVEIIGKVEVNGPIKDDEFVVKLPDDTRVDDVIKYSTHKSSEK